ncbi:NAD(P)-dependent alcohol dehydrogenase [Aquabacterium sp.]|uniref:NAD(P)-dependent alcohol dehydrogenase n=1 Tax=Aquabacterium sp. TaxID=1872578 RepID=UPI0025C3D08F|nr:NAD(P)-dependent alcohol dehydrogenase [Aquabacterium sp.]
MNALVDGSPLQHTASARRARAALARRPQTPLLLEDIDVAEPRADELLVRMVGSGICHTDIVCRDGFPVPMPIVLGHEGAGVVEAVGAAVTGYAPGDHVVMSFNSCGSCANCESHEPAYCHQFLGLNFGGAFQDGRATPLSQNGEPIFGNFFGQSSFASLAIVRASNAVKVDKSLPLAMLGPLGCGIQTGAGAVMNTFKLKPGRAIVVFGGGAVGLSAVMAAKALKASAVILVEPNSQRRALALELGATATIDPLDGSDTLAAIRAAGGGTGVSYALDTTGIPSVAATATEVLLPNGQLGLIGIPPPDAHFPMSIMSAYVKGIGIKCIVEGDSDPHTFIPQLIALHQDGQLPFDRLIKTFPFEQINEAIASSENGSVIKPVVLF